MMKYAPVLLGTTAALLAQPALGAIVFNDPGFENGNSTTMVDGVNYAGNSAGPVSNYSTGLWYMRGGALNNVQGGLLENTAVTGKTGNQFATLGANAWRGFFQYVNDGKATKGTITVSIDYWVSGGDGLDNGVILEVIAFDDPSTVNMLLSNNAPVPDPVTGSGFITTGGAYTDQGATSTPSTTGFTKTLEVELDLGVTGYNYVGVVFGNDDSQVSWDNLQVVVPEPGSLALLGLGGLCMMKRRRRA